MFFKLGLYLLILAIYIDYFTFLSFQSIFQFKIIDESVHDMKVNFKVRSERKKQECAKHKNIMDYVKKVNEGG